MKNINNTDHFLLAKEDIAHSPGTTTLELAGLMLAVVAVIAISALLI